MSKVQVTTNVFGPRFSETVLHELDPRYSRAEVDVAAGEAEIPFGSVLARNEDGTFAPLAGTAAQAAEEAAQAEGTAAKPRAILIHDLPAGETKALVLTGYCIVNAARLVLPEGADKKATLTALEDAGFVFRDIPEDVWEEK